MIPGFAIDLLNRTLSAAFAIALPQANVPFRGFTQEVPSSSKANDYAGLFDIPAVREWLGDRQIKEIEGYTYAITNKKWEISTTVKVDDLEDDAEQHISILGGKITGLALEQNNHMGRLIFDLLRAGKTGDAYDGKKFFATNHTTGANLIAGGGAPWYLMDTRQPLKPMILQMRTRPILRMPKADDESVLKRDRYEWLGKARYNAGYGLYQAALRSEEDLTEDNLQVAIETIMEQKDTHDRPINVEPNLLVVPPSLRTKAKKLLAETTSQGGSNVNAGAFELIVTPYVTEA